MKKHLAGVLIAALLVSGCTGSFNLTRKVYNFHRSQSDKWADELCFLLVSLTPIYGLATFADAIIFNSIEFWSGENPVQANNGQTAQEKLVRQGKDEVLVSYDAKSDELAVTPTIADQKQSPIVLERRADMVLAKDDQGQVLYSSMTQKNGDIVVYDAKGNRIKNFSASEIKTLKEKMVE